MELLDGGWRWWPHVVVRGAGFPADGIDRLADPALATAADALAEPAALTEPGDPAESGDPGRREAFARQYAAATARISGELRAIAASPTFLTALTWQNHHLLRTGIGTFTAGDTPPGRRNSKDRQREELIASYWQRYCVKNDSIGFFGPVGWAKLRPDLPTSRYEPGSGLVAHREVFFEAWAVDAVAKAVAAEPGVDAWIAPRRQAFIRLSGRTVVPAVGRPVELTEFEAQVLAGCDGVTAARDLVPGHAEQVYAVLAEMVRKRWVVWQLELPATPRPEEYLRAFLESVGDPGLRRGGLAKLDRFVAGRAQVAAATEPPALVSALEQLDATFTELTGATPERYAGRTYGGRTLVYHDCRRDGATVIGRDLAAAARPVGLLAHSARWLCAELSAALREPLLAHLRASGGGTDLATFWFRGMQPLVGAINAAMPGIRAGYARRWESILAPLSGERLRYGYDKLWPAVEQTFAADPPGWAGARTVSPDIMVCGPSLADPLLVLGELHTAVNTQRSNCFVTQHPDRAELLAGLDADFPEPLIFPVLPKFSPPRLSIRTHPGLTRDRDFLVEFGYHTAPAGRPRLVSGQDVTVLEQDGVVVVALPGGERFPVLDVFGEVLMDAVIDQVRLLGDRDRTPRVTVDRMVLCRQAWRFDPAGIGFATERDESARYLAARAWCRAQGLPRRGFVKAAGEKPVFVDFTSPVYVNVLAKAVRRAQAPVTFVEMLPDTDQLWLTDRDGRRYTSELRLVAVHHES